MFEDDQHTYTLYGDVYTNIFKVHKDSQQLDQGKWQSFVSRQRIRLQDEGYMIEEGTKAFVSLNRLKSVQYDNKAHLYYK
jgi:hypothetical protein